MSPSNYDKFLGELRLAGIELRPKSIVEQDGGIFGLDLQELTGEDVVHFPFNSSYLEKLERLKLPKFNASEYPPIFHLTNLTHLSMNSITAGNLPNRFYNLKNLQCLNIAGNHITRLSPRLGELSQLQCLALGTNLLVELPNVFDQLTELKQLYLYNNQLLSLPPTIGKLNQLEVLVIEDNNIEELPIEIMNLTDLKAFKFGRNPLNMTPGNYLWLDMLEKQGCRRQTLQEKTCYRFNIIRD